MNSNGWEKLNCKYFPSVCREVLSGYLEENGFAETKETNVGGLVFSRFDFFLEIGYDTNLFPKYVIKVVVGFGEEAYGEAGAFSGVPMWYILPEGHPFRTKVHWTFKGEEELKSVLLEVKKDFLEEVLQRLLANQEGLERVIKSFHSEFC